MSGLSRLLKNCLLVRHMSGLGVLKKVRTDLFQRPARVAGFAGIVLLSCLALAPAGSSRAQDGAPEEASPPPAAADALAAGRRAKGDRDLALAETHFQKALAEAEHGGEIYDAALEELTYHLPLMRVERYVLTGQWHRAEQSLRDLLEKHQSDEERSRHLVGLIAKVRDRNPDQGGVYTSRGAGRTAIEQIERRLERYLENHGRYPENYQELNAILPADRYPLEDYDIVHYVGRGRAYGLTLRSRADPDNLHRIQRTGLLR